VFAILLSARSLFLDVEIFDQLRLQLFSGFDHLQSQDR
jgi:hypothetical protein